MSWINLVDYELAKLGLSLVLERDENGRPIGFCFEPVPPPREPPRP
jgi:hypothetical protein